MRTTLTQQSVVGLLPWFDDPRPALIRSLSALANASTIADKCVSGIQSLTNSLRLFKDMIGFGTKGASYFPSVWGNLVNKIASFSYGITKTHDWVKKEIPQLNQIEGQVLRIREAKKVPLEGSVHLQTLDIEADTLTATAPCEKVQRGSEVNSTTFTIV